MTNRGDHLPRGYTLIDQNLNKKVMGCDLYFAVLKSPPEGLYDVGYKPDVLSRFPQNDYKDFPLPESVTIFCMPDGVHLQRRLVTDTPLPIYFTFVLTDANGERVYGVITFLFHATIF